MKITLLHKIIISLIGIIIITSIIQIIFKVKMKVQEGLSTKEIGRRLNRAFEGDKIKGAFEKAFDKNNMKRAFEDAFNPILDKLKSGFDPMIKGFTKFIDEVNNIIHNIIPQIGKDFQWAGEDIGNGIKLEFTNLGIGLKTGFQDVFEYIGLFKLVFIYIDDFFKKYIGSRINCGLEKIGNLRTCFIFYFMDMIGHIIYYVLVKMPIWIIKLITNGYVDLQPSVNLGTDMINCVDDFIYGTIGYHIIHYPQWVLDKCYLCTKIKDIPAFPVKSFKDQAHKLNIDWNKAIPELLDQPKLLFNDAGKQLKAAFNFKDPSSKPFDDSVLQSFNEIRRKYGVDV